jgi:hypothetical protein
MKFEKYKSVFEKINSTKLKRLEVDLFETAIRYARIRTDWYFMTKEEKMTDDELRTRAHNTFIDACNILSREMIKANEDASWRIELGNDRKEIGDFACYVHCFLGLVSR